MKRILLALVTILAMIGIAHADTTDAQWQVVSDDQTTCYPMTEVFRLGSGPLNSPEALQEKLPPPLPGDTEPMTLRRTSTETALFEAYDNDKFYAQLLVKGRTNCLQMLQAVKTHAQVTGKRKMFVAAYQDYRAEVARGAPPAEKSHRDAKEKSTSLKFSGQIVQYPKGESESRLKEAVPELSCMNFKGQQRACTVKTALLQTALVVAGFPPCLMGKEVAIFLKYDSVVSAMCDIAPNTAKSMFATYSRRYGAPHQKTYSVGPMAQVTNRWRAGDDSFTVIHTTGQDIYGGPLDSYSMIIEAAQASEDGDQ